MTAKTTLIPEIDYIINSDGLLVFTKKYLLERGHCCQSGCANCPYGYSQKIDPNIPAEFSSNWSDDFSDNFNDDSDDSETDE